jgi:predicted amidohydrolase
VLTNARIVSGNGSDRPTRFLAIADGKIAAVGFPNDDTPALSGARTIDANGLYVAATTFDRSAQTLIDGIRHVWVGHINVGDPGDVVIMRNNPGRVAPGYIPETNAIVAAVVDGVYYTARELNTRR